jgi:LuxR family quorum-sensing system transcriptional regulator CciR
MHVLIDEFVRGANSAERVADLETLIEEALPWLGVERFALTHHVDMARARCNAIRLHNYPAEWVEFFDKNRLGVSDPIHRASQVTSIGFRWNRVSTMIPLTPGDHAVLDRARTHGLGEGFTVPANVPGEAHGSCSFVAPSGEPIPDGKLPLAQLVGAFAFECARRLWRIRRGDTAPAPRLTDRQRDCLLWVARGKTDWEISRILGISQETVIQHLKLGRERYGVQKRTSLLILALFDSTISFSDIADGGYTLFWG